MIAHIQRLGLLATVVLALSAAAAGARDLSQYNLDGGLALQGFDPVAVFPEGGGAAMAGDPAITVVQDGVTYRFASDEHRQMFLADPNKFEPTYGGWCAYAMASGAKVMIQPQVFTIHGRRAHYFVSNRAKANFDREVADDESRADGFWHQISGEDPRN